MRALNLERWLPYIHLMRLHRPIGIFLVLWPTLWALWLAGDGRPSIANVIIFTLGALVMRSAGCVINDYADRKIDGHVERTRDRPLATGALDPKHALLLFGGLCLLALCLVLLTNAMTIYLSVGGLLLAGIYPYILTCLKYFSALLSHGLYRWLTLLKRNHCLRLSGWSFWQRYFGPLRMTRFTR